MKQANALDLITEMKFYAESAGVSLLLVGSIGYRTPLQQPENFALCDDVDCVFVYDKTAAMTGCPYVDETFFQKALETVRAGMSDMVSTKIERHGIKISADFVSMAYLSAIAVEPIEGCDKFRLKATNAIENETNIYADFWGDKIVYQKTWHDAEGIRFYKLPIHLFRNGRFYPGVLLNKFLYNPAVAYEAPNAPLTEALNAIFKQVQDTCINSAGNDPFASVANTAYKREEFSAYTIKFFQTKATHTKEGNHDS